MAVDKNALLITEATEKLEKAIRVLEDSVALAQEKTEDQENFEDLIFHEMIGLIKRSANELWIADKETAKLEHKANISMAIRILEYWDDLKEEG